MTEVDLMVSDGVAVASFRREVGPSATGWEPATEAERASQMWSLRRRAIRAGDR